MTRHPHRRTGELTRTAILEAAAEAFGRQGFDVATLEGIGAQVGITRSAVLHYFRSKEELLAEIVEPFMTEVDALLDRVTAEGVMTPRQTRPFLADLVDLVCDHRPAAAILSRDITAHNHLGPALQMSDRARRYVELLTPPGTTQGARVAALAALGAVMRPLAAPDGLIDLDDQVNRRILTQCAVAALRAGLTAAGAPVPLNARHQTIHDVDRATFTPA